MNYARFTALATAVTLTASAQAAGELQEIVVTAELRQTPLLQTSRSVSVITSEEITQRSARHLEEVLAAAKEDLASEDDERISGAHQKVEQAMHKFAETLYKSQGEAEGGPEAAEAEAAGDTGEDIIEAEYTEEKGS